MPWRENIENGLSQGEKDAGHKLAVVIQGIGIKNDSPSISDKLPATFCRSKLKTL